MPLPRLGKPHCNGVAFLGCGSQLFGQTFAVIGNALVRGLGASGARTVHLGGLGVLVGVGAQIGCLRAIRRRLRRWIFGRGFSCLKCGKRDR
jgi:hypothetical protein